MMEIGQVKLQQQKLYEELGDLPVQIVQIPDAMDPDEYLQKNSPEDLAYLLANTRISPIEFIFIIINLVIMKIYKHKSSLLRKLLLLSLKNHLSQLRILIFTY